MFVPTLTLKDSIQLPLIGFGTWRLYDKECEKAVRLALETGYRHIDTAHLYENHHEIAKCISSYPREELFLTSKFMTPSLPQTACEKALRELKTDYLDAFLLHWPDRSTDMKWILEEMVKLKERGLTRSIGVSNFTIGHLKDVAPFLGEIAINQVEYHAFLNQKKLRHFCEQYGIHIVSFRSLGQGELVQDPLLTKIGRTYHKSAAQISLRFLVQQGIPVIPKASKKERIEENFQIFDFELTTEDFAILDQVPQRPRYCEPDRADFNYE